MHLGIAVMLYVMVLGDSCSWCYFSLLLLGLKTIRMQLGVVGKLYEVKINMTASKPSEHPPDQPIRRVKCQNVSV